MTLSKVICLNLLWVFASTTVVADEIPAPPSLATPDKQQNVQAETPPPPLPDEADDSRNIPQPEVTIIRKKDAVIEEYRVHGRLRFVKITPRTGKPYYMVDTDGDGILETRENDLANPPINRWILLEW